MQENYREFIRRSIWYTQVISGRGQEHIHLALGVGGEAGEFAELFKKMTRNVGFDETQLKKAAYDPEFVYKMLSELGDVLWYMTRVLDIHDLTLDDLMLLNTAKLYSRHTASGELTGEELWKGSNMLFDAASKSTQRIETQNMAQSASISTDIDTKSKPPSKVPWYKRVRSLVWSWTSVFSRIQ